MRKFVEKTTLAQRGPIESRPPVAVEGTLLCAEESVLSYEEGHSECGYLLVHLFPAFHDGVRCWVAERRWIPSARYSAGGDEEQIIPYMDGLAILAEQGWAAQLHEAAPVPARQS